MPTVRLRMSKLRAGSKRVMIPTVMAGSFVVGRSIRKAVMRRWSRPRRSRTARWSRSRWAVWLRSVVSRSAMSSRPRSSSLNRRIVVACCTCAGPVVAVPRARVDPGRHQHADVRVVPQRHDSDTAQRAEPTDRYQADLILASRQQPAVSHHRRVKRNETADPAVRRQGTGPHRCSPAALCSRHVGTIDATGTPHSYGALNGPALIARLALRRAGRAQTGGAAG